MVCQLTKVCNIYTYDYKNKYKPMNIYKCLKQINQTQRKQGIPIKHYTFDNNNESTTTPDNAD